MASNSNSNNGAFHRQSNWDASYFQAQSTFANYHIYPQNGTPTSMTHSLPPQQNTTEYPSHVEYPQYFEQGLEPGHRNDQPGDFNTFAYGANVGVSSNSLSPNEQPRGFYPYTPGSQSDTQDLLSPGDASVDISPPNYTHQQSCSPHSLSNAMPPGRMSATPKTFQPDDSPDWESTQSEEAIPVQPKIEAMSPPAVKPVNSTAAKKASKKNHNEVERCYRIRLNDKINALGDTVFSDGSEIRKSSRAKPAKCIIIAQAKDTIDELRANKIELEKKLAEMQTRLAVLEHSHQQHQLVAQHSNPRHALR